MRLLGAQRNQKGETHPCSCNLPKHLRDLFQQLVSNIVCISSLRLALPPPSWPQLPYLAQDLTHQPLGLLSERSFWPVVQGTQGNPAILLKPSCIIYSAFRHKLIVRSLRFRAPYWGLHSVPSLWTNPATSTLVAIDVCNCNSSRTCRYVHTHTQSFERTLLRNSRSLGSNDLDFLLGILRVRRWLLSMYVLIVWR